MSGQIRQLRERLKNIVNIRQVTKAMKLVSTAKFSRFLRLRETTTPFLKDLSAQQKELFPIPPSAPFVILLALGTEKGFCGSYNYQIAQFYWKDFKSLKKKGQGFAGFQGKRFFQALKRLVKQDHLALPQLTPLALDDFYQMTESTWEGFFLLKSFKFLPSAFWFDGLVHCLLTLSQQKGVPIELRLFYQKFLSPVEQIPQVESVIFDAKSDFILPGDMSESQREMFPSVWQHLSYLDQIQRLLLIFQHAGLSEHAARRNAMDSAEKNAQEIENGIRQRYQRVRQASITNDIIEIIGGVEVLNRKKRV